MNTTLQDEFKFYVPLDINKATKDEDGSWLLSGVAGDGMADTEKENLDYDAFDTSRMYYVNWEHGKDPEDVVGVIVNKNIKKGKIHLTTKLMKDMPKAKGIWTLAKALEKEGFNLGYSVEGKVLERSPLNKNIVTKAELYGVAICKVPINPRTYAQIVKSFQSGAMSDDLQKMDTADIAPAMPESVEKKRKKKKGSEEEAEVKEVLTKSQIYIEIFNNFTKNSAVADGIFNLIKAISMETTLDHIKKAQEILGLAKASDSAEPAPAATDDLSKGGQADMAVAGDENGGDIETLEKAMMDAEKSYTLAKANYEKACEEKGMSPKSSMLSKGEEPEYIGRIEGNIDLISKAIEIRTKALGSLLLASEETFNSKMEELNSQLEKSVQTIEKLEEFNNELSNRLGIVEKTPIRKSVTTENYKERFAGDLKKGGENTFSITHQKNDLIQYINDAYGNDLEKSENVAMLQAAAELEMTGKVTPNSINLLKSKGIDLVA
jgi:hypothetical protein